MNGRSEDVAALAGVPVDQVEPVDRDTVIAALTGSVDPLALEFVTSQESNVWFWRVGSRYFLDDAYWGPVTDFRNLAFDDDMGVSDASLRHN